LFYLKRFVASDNDATAAWGLLVTVSIVVSRSAALGGAAFARNVSRLRLLIAIISGPIASLLLLSLDLPRSSGLSLLPMRWRRRAVSQR
jgi:hypothetical protein